MSGKAIRVLLADDSVIMLQSLRKLLEPDEAIDIVGEASTFGAAAHMVVDLRPDILVLDLHMPQELELDPASVREQLNGAQCILAISFANDEEAKSLAVEYGAVVLLDKMTLYGELLPAIKRLGAVPGSCRLEAPPRTEGLSLEPPE